MRLLAVLILLLSISFAAECTGYEGEFTIRALDALIRPVEGASVQLTFDRGVTFGQQYFTTQPKRTDENGTALFVISNPGEAPRKIDCNIYVNAWTGTTYAKKTFSALSHPEIIDVKLPVYRVVFSVRDQNRQPIADASVFFVNETKKTDAGGKAVFYSQNATSDYYVSYKSGSEGGSVAVKGDTERDVVIPVYQMSVFVKDDYGNPLPAVLSCAGEEINAPNGSASFPLYQDTVQLKIRHENIEKEISVKPAEGRTKTVFFDLNPPLIGEPAQSLSDGRVRMSFEIKDEGPYASGLDIYSIKVSYRVLPEETWHHSLTYPLGGDSYGIDFPEMSENAVVEFSVQAADYEGNKAYRNGRFLVSATAQSEDTQKNNVVNEEFPWLYAFLVIIFIIIAFYVLKILLPQQKQSG